jgi:hypothetical protein
MIAAVSRLAARGNRRFLVKDHPMTPRVFADGNGVERTTLPLGRHERLSAVVFAATTVGLEALLLGLPTVRFRPAATFAIDILPAGVTVPVAGPDDLGRVLDGLSPPAVPDRERVLATPDRMLWKDLLSPGETTYAQ